jgi:hypothetical protein
MLVKQKKTEVSDTQAIYSILYKKMKFNLLKYTQPQTLLIHQFITQKKKMLIKCMSTIYLL